MVQVTAMDSFSHDRINAKRGDKIDMPDATAKELAKKGLVKLGAAPVSSSKPLSPATGRRSRSAPVPSNKKAPEPDNKKVG